jgi:hypothetical protein
MFSIRARTLLCVITISAACSAQEIPSTNPRATGVPGSFQIRPIDPTVATGEKLQFSIEPNSSSQVKWLVNGKQGGDQDVGIIDGNGLYTAPDEVPDAPPKITAISLAAPSLKGEAHIIVTQASCPKSGKSCVGIVPGSDIVKVGQRIGLRANVAGFEVGGIEWFVNDKRDGEPAIGRIVHSGLPNSVYYQAPLSVPQQKITVKAVARSRTVAVKVASGTAAIIVVSKYVAVRCSSPRVGGNSPRCIVVDFDRLAQPRGTIGGGQVTDDTPARFITAINGSKAISSGSILDVRLPSGATKDSCANLDWKMVAQVRESPNILIYNPADVGAGVCVDGHFVIALPVHVLWADVGGFPQAKDPSRTAPVSSSSYLDCLGQPAPQTIYPCDRHASWLISGLYKTSWLMTHFGQSGAAQGTISLSPVIGTGARQLAFDVQADPAYKVAGGWLNIPLIFEKSTSQGSNLDAFLVGLAFDFRWLRSPNVIELPHFVLRKPQLRVQSGTEIAPTTPHDINYVQSATIKIPLVFGFHQQPSTVTTYPVVGIEGGSHIQTHIAENDSILRGVGGVDGSFRWPYNVTHSFLGSSPITLDYSYRMRWLAFEEPTTNPAGTGTERLSAQRHEYFRASLVEPLTANFQFQVTYQSGSLPPNFRVLSPTLTLGLTFSNPGSSEH